MRTRVKICGITRPEDAIAAAVLGADAIGLVFYEQSPRRVSCERAAEIVAALPLFVHVVALFVDAQPAEVHQVLDRMRIDIVQLHGDEPPEYCRDIGRPYIKAVRMRPGTDVRACAARYQDAGALLLDTFRADAPGGTGVVFPWGDIPAEPGCRVILAGGLTPDNVERAIQTAHPYAVDVSGGVESAKGVKDARKMADFIEGVQRADDARRRGSVG